MCGISAHAGNVKLRVPGPKNIISTAVKWKLLDLDVARDESERSSPPQNNIDCIH
jgi:hypothetical protein